MTDRSRDRLQWLVFATHVGAEGAGGGMVRYVVEFARALQHLDNVDVHVLARPGARAFFSELLGDERRVHAVPDLPTPVLSSLEAAGPAIRALRRPFDVVHGTKHLLPRRPTGLSVLTVHDMLSLDRPEDHRAMKVRLLRGPYLRSIRTADVLVCVSEATRERLRAYVPERADEAVVVPSAVAPGLLATTPRPVRELVDRRFALVVGDASPRKNLGLVIDGWGAVAQRVPDAVLAVVGPPGWGVEDRGVAYDELRRDGRLVALGQVDDGELAWCYEHASVVLCPSLQEGFGLPAVEALAFDAPLITSRDPALCEVTGEAAIHIDATDEEAWVAQISRALGRPREHARRGPVRSWTDVAHETYEAVVGVRDRGRPRSAATAGAAP